MKTIVLMIVAALFLAGCPAVKGPVTGLEYTPNPDGSVTVYNPKTDNTYKVYKK